MPLPFLVDFYVLFESGVMINRASVVAVTDCFYVVTGKDKVLLNKFI